MPTNRILVVSSHGIGLREILLNETFSSRLLQQFEIDVMSPFTSIHPEEWNIRKHYEIGQASGIGRLIRSLNHRAVSSRVRMVFKRFYDETGWEFIYEALRFYRAHTKLTTNYDRWAKLERGPLGAVVSLATRGFPIRSPQTSLITKENYDAVIVTHPIDGECLIASQIAGRVGVPIISMVLGIDHLFLGGPVLMNPDLLLVWGSEQVDDWRDHHAAFRPQLKKTRVVQVGGLAHDRLTSETDTQVFTDEYPLIDPQARVVTFAAFSETAYPDQPGTCDAILKTFTKLGIKGHLVVRVRPGREHKMWFDYALTRPGLVTIQIPSGVFYTKWITQSQMDRANEERDVRLFGATLRRSDLVVTAGFSTVYLDAFAAGTPAIAVAISPESTTGPSHLEETYKLYAKNVKSIALVDLITSFEHLEKKVTQALTPDRRNILEEDNRPVYKLVGGCPDKLAGKRAADAIFEFLESADST